VKRCGPCSVTILSFLPGGFSFGVKRRTLASPFRVIFAYKGIAMDQPLPFEIPNVTVLLQPEEQVLEIPRHKVKNVKQLLKYLGIRECTALVARGRELLTPDRAVLPHDSLLVRKVTSSG